MSPHPGPDPVDDPSVAPATVDRLRCAVVLRVEEDRCEVSFDGARRWIGYARQLPRPRPERISPGHLVAVARTADGTEVAVWRWYDAVVLDEQHAHTVLWEPAHGEVRASRRPGYRPGGPGSRAYLSAGLPGAEWWVAGPVTGSAADAGVELDEVDRLYTEHGLWEGLAPG